MASTWPIPRALGAGNAVRGMCGLVLSAGVGSDTDLQDGVWMLGEGDLDKIDSPKATILEAVSRQFPPMARAACSKG